MWKATFGSSNYFCYVGILHIFKLSQIHIKAYFERPTFLFLRKVKYFAYILGKRSHTVWCCQHLWWFMCVLINIDVSRKLYGKILVKLVMIINDILSTGGGTVTKKKSWQSGKEVIFLVRLSGWTRSRTFYHDGWKFSNNEEIICFKAFTKLLYLSIWIIIIIII